jgi:hypothetical protein
MKNELNEQTVIFEENFEVNSPTAEKWEFSDRDGNNKNWYWNNSKSTKKQIELKGFSGNACISISSDVLHRNDKSKEIDNLLISPPINLPSSGRLFLSFQIGAYSEDLPKEHYAVYILLADKIFKEDETPVFEETLTSNEVNAAAVRNIDITDYTGKEIKVYFRHFKSKQYAIILDNVKITQQ